MASTQNQSAHVDLFDAFFRRADLDRDDRISGNEAVAFFQVSSLPKQVLAQNEEQDDPYERWDPDSDMEVDDECKPLPSRVKKEIVEPEVKDLKQTSENAGSSGYDPAVDEITTGAKALDMGSGSVDEPTVKVEQDTMNKPADQI
ncbi:histone deacetylase 19-like isoform X2 [Malus domestica]|uniref:histone deacetylase 19-like isoform X2 n=1 Tax=Malus domestica TaxID=3750 RepID=UPI003975FED9